ncbi:hypothetical protein [Sulfitobacter sp. R18_1]|uniref:hypothetical protein n=1 Tax=Sulfitobacter sp. R18_1 TaxID=2821104 RepID=UPI001ADBC1FE|nr:hypothetical protein [Sulfitobacter sp. R18_1]MBO9427956.1 hypothetical protein [Sulfitobacter sp. R18_1]
MRRIYLDCDGVLADFDRAFREKFNCCPVDYRKSVGTDNFWEDIVDLAPDFYRNLPLMPDAMELYMAVSHRRPIILTGCPTGGWSELQKILWGRDRFPGVPMIVCASKDKGMYCQPGDVLIDDRTKYAYLWRDEGGVFISCAARPLPSGGGCKARFHRNKS